MDLAANISDTHIPSGANISSNLSSAQIDAIGGTMEALDEFGAIDDCLFRPTMENYGMIFAFCVIFCLSVIGNSIVVVVILQQSSMRSVTNLYLLNLALSDLLLSVVCMPPTLVSSLVYCWVFGDLLCKLLAYLQPVVVTASAYTLAAIALERYYAICKPLHSRIWHTRTHAMFVISLVWLVSVIANVFMLFMYEERTYNRNGLNCAPKFEPIVHFGYQIYMTVVLLLIPLVAMTVLYGNVISTLNAGIRMDIAAVEIENNNNENGAVVGCSMKKKCSPNVSVMFTADLPTEPKKTRLWHPFIKSEAREAPQHKNSMAWRNASLTAAEQSLRSTHSGKTAIAKQRLIRMLIVIVVVFFCCWTPSYIWWLLLNAQDAFGTFNIWNSELNTFITILTYLSSCTNPITYCFLNNKFRNALFLTFGCRSPVRGSTRARFMRGAHNIQHRQRHTPRTENDSDGSNPNNTSESGAKRKDKKTANCCMDLLVRTKWTLPSLARRISSRKYRIEEGNEMRALNNIE